MIRTLMITILLSLSPSLLAECRQDSLHLSLIPKKDMTEQIDEYQPLISLLQQQLGLRVDIFKASSYQAVVDGLVSGAVDVAVLGPASYVLAYQQDPGIEPFASLAMAGGHFTPAGSYYQSLLLVRENSRVQRLEQLQGLAVALSDPASTSGALIPARDFPRAAGKSLNSLFGTRVYAGSHDKALNALLAGRVDAAFVSSARADEYISRGIMKADQVRELWRSVPIHYDPFVFRSGLCDGLKRRIGALLAGSPAVLAPFLASQQAVRFTPVSHNDYHSIIGLVSAP